MYRIHITNNIQNSITLIPDYFIDRHLAGASGDFIKVYLYIQRHLKEGTDLTIQNIADHLNLTDADVERALAYWKSEQVLVFDEEAAPAEPERPEEASRTYGYGKTEPARPQAPVLPGTISLPEKENLSPAVVTSRLEEEGLSHLVFMADTYLGKPLSPNELNTLFYFYDQLHFPIDLIEYLLEYCVSNQKKSMRYIEAVAISWFEQGIDTMRKAKDSMKIYNRNYFAVMKAFGISNRNPAPVEADYIKKWLEEYHFDLSIILEACSRTLTKTGQPSFPYTDSILKNWNQAGVRTTEDIRRADEEYHMQKASQTQPAGTGRPDHAQQSRNRFHNFEQRDYNYQDLEEQFIRKVNGIQ